MTALKIMSDEAAVTDRKHIFILFATPLIFFVFSVVGLDAHHTNPQQPSVPIPVKNNDSLDPASADAIYLKGQKAFREGRDREAADLVMEAARKDWRCHSMLGDARFAGWLPPTPCSRQPGLKRPEGNEDPGAETLYRLGMIRRNSSVPEMAGTDPRGRYFLERLVSEFKSGAWADDAALVLVEDGFCIVDEGYPECVAWRIKKYERWLGEYPYSDRRAQVLTEVAKLYLELAKRYDEPSAWTSAVTAELCRGRAMEVARKLASRHYGRSEARWAVDFIGGIKSSGKPYSMAPEGAVSSGRGSKPGR
jgi:hypothetical protein